MTIHELVADQRNSLSHTSLASPLAKVAYRRAQDDLSRFSFWNGPKGTSLWEHQRAAAAVCTAYLAAQPRLRDGTNRPEAALVKMPTGTGKSGVIAVMARCLRDIRRVLIVTPREALVTQMMDDLGHRFWDRVKYVPQAAARGAVLMSGADRPVIEATHIARLLPSRAPNVLRAAADTSQRLIVVSTFHSLAAIRRLAIADVPNEDARTLFELLRDSLDVVFVDEGHYEPAHDWGRSVRALGAPTILFSATPYRNDYKSFLVRGGFVFNFPFEEATQKRIVREVDFVPPIPSDKVGEIQKFVDNVVAFYGDRLDRPESVGFAGAKLLVRADDLDDLRSLQTELEKKLGVKAVLVHDRETDQPLRRRFGSVQRARREPASTAARIWLHDSKLLEGIDDELFAGVAIYAPFGNARQLVQQVGRVIRSTDRSRKRAEHAFVTASESGFNPITRMWKGYLGFEAYCAKKARNIVQNEANLPSELLRYLPDTQYVDRQFRARFPLEAAPAASEIRIPRTAAIFVENKPVPLDALAQDIIDDIEEVDRFEIRQLVDPPAEMLVIAYFAWGNSKFLMRSFFPEWSLGIFTLSRVGRYVFVEDSDGIVLDADRLGWTRVDALTLHKLFPRDDEVRVTQMAFIGLDMSERAIRSQTLRARSFRDTFADLSQASSVPTAVTGVVGGRRRYVGLRSARLTEASGEFVALDRFRAWTESVATVLDAKGAAPNEVFSRYAQLVRAPRADDGRPVNVLFDLSSALVERLAGDDDNDIADIGVVHDDLCSDVDEEGKCAIILDGTPYSAVLKYHPAARRYRMESEELNLAFPATVRDGTQVPSLVTRLNAEQDFRVITRGGAIYANRYFYRADLRFRAEKGPSPLLGNVFPIDALVDATSEKGQAFYRDRDRWRRESVFGLVSSMCKAQTARPDWGQLADDLRTYEIIVCDDGGDEIADYILLNRSLRRIALVHAKADEDGARMGLNALQAVGRQAIASLAYASTLARSPGDRSTKWAANLRIETLDMPRTLRSGGVPPVDLGRVVGEAIEDRSWSREIWMVLGRILDYHHVNARLNVEEPNNRARQFGMFLEGLRTACGRGNAQLRIYCPTSLQDVTPED